MTELEIRIWRTALSSICLRPPDGTLVWPCDLWPKNWRIHPCPKMHQRWQFGEIQSSNFQDIALTRPKSAFFSMLDRTVTLNLDPISSIWHADPQLWWGKSFLTLSWSIRQQFSNVINQPTNDWHLHIWQHEHRSTALPEISFAEKKRYLPATRRKKYLQIIIPADSSAAATKHNSQIGHQVAESSADDRQF